MKHAIIAALALCLAACTTTGTTPAIPTSPAAIADKTTIDERAMNVIEAAATAAPKAATLSIRVGLVTDRATIAKIGELNERLDAAMRRLEAAYEAANADSFWPLYNEALALVQSINGTL